MPLSNVVIDLYHGDTVDPDSGFHDMKSAGILALIHKATEGVGHVDSEYDTRFHRAKSVDLLWGSYHFGLGGDPEQQAEHYLQTANPKDDELICLDFEPSSHAPSMSLAEAEAFVQAVKDKSGRFPVLYSGFAFLHSVLGSTLPGGTVLSNCPLWIARFNSVLGDLPPAFADFVLWQYTGDGQGPNPHRVPGVLNVVDREKFNGTEDQLKTAWPFA